VARWWPWVLALVPALLASAPAAAAEVVVNAARPEASLSRSLVRGMFGMRVRAWPDGAPVRVFVLADSDPLHQEFSKSVLQMYPYQLRQNWDRLLYSGTGQPPVLVSSEAELLQRVAETPGAIGYVRALPKSDPNSTRPGSEPAANVKVLNVR
jgi:hypothetical protein